MDQAADSELAGFWTWASVWAAVLSVPGAPAKECFYQAQGVTDEGGAGGQHWGLCSLNAIHMTL